MRLWPNNAVARYYAAVAAEQVGDFERAIEDYRYAMRIDVNATDAYLRLARLQAAAGRYEAARLDAEFHAGRAPRRGRRGAAADAHARRASGARSQIPALPAQRLLARPEHWGAAVAALGEGVRERSGPKAALEAMRSAKPLELDDPDTRRGARGDRRGPRRDRQGRRRRSRSSMPACASTPTPRRFHALRGRALALSQAHRPRRCARPSSARSSSTPRTHARAGRPRARSKRDAGANEAALALYERAVAADPDEPRPPRARPAALLVGDRPHARRPRSASTRCCAIIPTTREAARLLAELRLARGAKDERTLELARRAVAFGGGAEAKALLERVGGSRRKAAAAERERDAG